MKKQIKLTNPYSLTLSSPHCHFFFKRRAAARSNRRMPRQ